MQLHPIKPTLKPPGTKRLQLTYDEPLSNFASKFKLRRYVKDKWKRPDVQVLVVSPKVRRCWLAVSKPVLKAPMLSALEA